MGLFMLGGLVGGGVAGYMNRETVAGNRFLGRQPMRDSCSCGDGTGPHDHFPVVTSAKVQFFF